MMSPDDFIVKKNIRPKDESFIESKYRPECIDDIIGHSDLIKTIESYVLSDMLSIKKYVLLIKGPVSCGKKVTVDMVMKKLGFKIVSYGMEDSHKKTLFIETIEKALGGYNGTKTVMVIRNINNAMRETLFTTFLKLIRKKGSIPIICICSSKTISKGYRKACVNIVTVDYPLAEECIPFVEKLCVGEGLVSDRSAIEYIAQMRKPRDIYNMIKLMTLGKERSSWTSSDIKQILEFSGSDSYMNSMEVINTVFNEPLDPFPFDKRQFTDQPYSAELLYSNLGFVKDIDKLADIYDALIYSDQLETKMFSTQTWEYKEYSTIVSLAQTTLALRSIPKPRSGAKYKIKNNAINNLQGIQKRKKKNIYDIKDGQRWEDEISSVQTDG